MKKFVLVLSLVLMACSSPTEPVQPDIYTECWPRLAVGAWRVGLPVSLLYIHEQKNYMVVDSGKGQTPYRRWLIELVPNQNKDMSQTRPWSCKDTEISIYADVFNLK